jgi:hypothetical protein
MWQQRRIIFYDAATAWYTVWAGASLRTDNVSYCMAQVVCLTGYAILVGEEELFL